MGEIPCGFFYFETMTTSMFALTCPRCGSTDCSSIEQGLFCILLAKCNKCLLEFKPVAKT